MLMLMLTQTPRKIISSISFFLQRHLENSRRRGDWGGTWEQEQQAAREMRDIQVRVILMIMVCYPTWEDVVNQVRAIEANHSELVSVQTIGR